MTHEYTIPKHNYTQPCPVKRMTYFCIFCVVRRDEATTATPAPQVATQRGTRRREKCRNTYLTSPPPRFAAAEKHEHTGRTRDEETHHKATAATPAPERDVRRPWPPGRVREGWIGARNVGAVLFIRGLGYMQASSNFEGDVCKNPTRIQQHNLVELERRKF